MLHFETITTETLVLLRAFQSFDSFRGLRLAGGPSLALQYGHRRSVDLDFFGTKDLSDDDLLLTLKEIGPTRPLRLSKTIKTLTC